MGLQMAVGSLGFSYLTIVMGKKAYQWSLCQEGWVMMALFHLWMLSLTSIPNHQILIDLIFLR